MTESELIQQVREALSHRDDPEGFYTTLQWCEMLGLAHSAVRRRLKKLLMSGRMERGWVSQTSIMDGIERRIKAYRFVPPED